MKTIAAIIVASFVACGFAKAAGTKVTLDDNGVMVIDGHPTFVISVSIPPPPGGKTPTGRDAFEQLAEDGLTLMRVRPTTGPEKFGEADLKTIVQWLDAAAAHHLYCWVTTHKLTLVSPQTPEHERLLRELINMYKDHPGLAAWKGFDEAAWVKVPPGKLASAYKLLKELDPNHPVIVIQAPTKASLPLEGYRDVGDIFGVDIFPITYPPGNHSDFGNRNISIVADCAQWIRKAAAPKPFWMTLQIAWAGTATPGKTLRFPTFPQIRYMTYAAIINGARGVNFQGGERPLSLNERDTKLGWNWTQWDKVMRRLVAELRESSPLHPALIAPDSKLRVKLEGATDIDYCVRKTPESIFLLAAKREGEVSKVKFTGLPLSDCTSELLYEEPRNVTVKNGAFEDWFAPNEVHVYKFRRRGDDK